MKAKKFQRSSVWIAATLAVVTLTGCGMYPSKPGHWPGGIWGQFLQSVSSLLDLFARLFGGSYGLSLLVVTVLVRFLVLPLMIKQIRYSKSLQMLQPEIKKIRDKYQGDNRKIQEETMKMYQQAGVNPMAGCFPTLVQLPVLYALFGAIEGNVGLSTSTFMGIFNLGKPDHLYILPVLAAVTTYFSSKMMMTGNDQQQKMMLFMMPVFVLLIGLRFPGGLALYWIYGNIFTAVQAYFIRVRPANAATIDVQAGGDDTKKRPKRGSSK